MLMQMRVAIGAGVLILLGADYDGGHKAWVRWADGSDDIVPGSQVQGDAVARAGQG